MNFNTKGVYISSGSSNVNMIVSPINETYLWGTWVAQS